MFFLFLCITYFLYTSLSISNIVSTISFSKINITSSSMSAVMNDYGASITAKYRPPVALIAMVMRTDSVTAVSEVMSDFFNPSLCFRLSATEQPFIFPHRFCFKNITTCSAPFFYFFVSCFPLIKWNTTLL